MEELVKYTKKHMLIQKYMKVSAEYTKKSFNEAELLTLKPDLIKYAKKP